MKQSTPSVQPTAKWSKQKSASWFETFRFLIWQFKPIRLTTPVKVSTPVDRLYDVITRVWPPQGRGCLLSACTRQVRRLLESRTPGLDETFAVYYGTEIDEKILRKSNAADGLTASYDCPALFLCFVAYFSLIKIFISLGLSLKISELPTIKCVVSEVQGITQHNPSKSISVCTSPARHCHLHACTPLATRLRLHGRERLHHACYWGG